VLFPLADRPRQYALAHRRRGARPGQSPEGGHGPPDARRARRLRAPLSVGAVRQHAAARRHHARPRPRPRDAPHGRALRRARRDDARAHEPRARAARRGDCGGIGAGVRAPSARQRGSSRLAVAKQRGNRERAEPPIGGPAEWLPARPHPREEFP